MDGLFFTTLALALGMAGLLSGMEAGVFALSRFRVRRLARQGDRRAIRLQRFLEGPENFLWTILVGNTLAIWVVVTLVARRLEDWLGGQSIGFMIALAAVLYLLYVIAELFPKLVFRRSPDRLCLAGVGLFRLVHAALSPIVAATEWVSSKLMRLTNGYTRRGRLLGSRTELRHALQESAAALSSEELVIVNRVLNLQSLRVRDVMTPMEKAATLEATDRVQDLLALVRERHVSYLPVWKRSSSSRRVLGVVAIRGVLYDEVKDPATQLQSLVQPALFIDENSRLEDALRMMQRGRQRLAIVLGTKRREIGVITLNDILRAMFGEVRV